MNREIKFRAWSKATEKMSDWDFIHSVRNLHKLMTLNHIELMQYTGLKDKNGKEIYEGDIIELFWGFTGRSYFTTVIWVKDLAKWAMAEKNGKGVYHYFGDQNTKLMDTEIIGNIYENKDLI